MILALKMNIALKLIPLFVRGCTFWWVITSTPWHVRFNTNSLSLFVPEVAHFGGVTIDLIHVICIILYDFHKLLWIITRSSQKQLWNFILFLYSIQETQVALAGFAWLKILTASNAIGMCVRSMWNLISKA